MQLKLLAGNMNTKEQIELWADELKDKLNAERKTFLARDKAGESDEIDDVCWPEMTGEMNMLRELKKFLNTLDGEADRLKGYEEGLKGALSIALN
jgi:hypothetical protein